MFGSVKTWLTHSPALYFKARLILFAFHKQVARIVPDALFLQMQYFLRRRRILRLRQPVLYNEKLQWLKLNYRNPLLKKCVDKWEVREYVASKGLERILIPSFGVFDAVSEMNLDALPGSFILKLTNGSGFNEICFDKANFDVQAASARFAAWSSIDFYAARREWAYKGVKNRILCEELLTREDGGVPNDYRFFCFHGKAHLIAVDLDSVVAGKKTSKYYRHLFTPNWVAVEGQIQYPRKTGTLIDRPLKLDEMIKIAEILAKDFPAVRVDLYLLDDMIFFGELTFYHASGYQRISPQAFERQLGDLLDLELIKRESWLVR